MRLEKSPTLIRESFEYMMDMKQRPDTWSEIDSIFNTCTNVGSEQDVEYLYEHLSNGYLYMAMTDYPYPANFLEPMPAWPVSQAVIPFADIPLLSEVEEQQEEKVVFPTSTARKLMESSKSSVGGMSNREAELLTALAESTNVYFNYTG